MPQGINLQRNDTMKGNNKSSITSDAEVRFIPYIERRLLSYFIGEQKLDKVCYHQIIDSFKNEIAVLRKMITEIDASKFPKVKRFGLPIFPQDLLR